MSGKEIIQTKLVFLGEAAVGKSSIVLRFVKDEFSLGSESTIGAAFLTAQIDINERQTVKYEIWDTAGQENILFMFFFLFFVFFNLYFVIELNSIYTSLTLIYDFIV